MDSTDKAWERFQAALKRDEGKAADADARASKWLADGNEAMAAGNVERAVKCYGKSQFWRDRYNRLAGRA